MNFLKKYYYILTGIIAFIIYMFTIAPSVVQIDTGELAAVQLTLGIAHPTGYPLFTILGYLFSLIPLPFSKIFQMNLLASLYCAAAISLFTYTSKLILENLSAFQFKKIVKEKSKKKKEIDKNQAQENKYSDVSELAVIMSSIFSSLFLSVSKTFWFQSTSVEVYSLHILLISLIILFLIKAFLFSYPEKLASKQWLVFALGLALGFTNHMTTILIIPGVAVLYFMQNGFNIRSIKQILVMLSVFFPVLILIYSYLPLRAAQNPLLNWGNPVEWERIIRHISGQQYQVWLFSSTEAAEKQFKYFFNNLPYEYTFVLIIAVIGIAASYIRARKFFIFNMIVFATTVLYSINYDIHDIDSYFLLAFTAIAYFALFGLVQITEFALIKKVKAVVLVLIFSLFFGFQLQSSYKDVNQSGNYVYKDYTMAVLNPLPKNSIVFSYQWDYFLSASYYFQLVENFRKDVVVIDKELLRRSWYYNQLETNYPGLLSGIKPEVNQFLEALKPFEREQKDKTNNQLLELLFRKIMTGLISTNIDKYNYFIAPEIVDGEMKRGEFQLPDGHTIVPYAFMFKVVNTDEYVEAPLPDYKINILRMDDKYQSSLRGFVVSMLIRRGLYEVQFNRIDLAKIYAKKLAADYSDVTLPPALAKLVLN